MNKNVMYLLSVLESVEKVKIYTRDYINSDEFFEANHQKDFNATLNLLIAIGEDAKNLDESLKNKESNIQWQSIIDMRNILSHNYRGVDKDIVWDIVTNYLDPLKKACIKLLKGLKPNKSKLKNILNTFYYRDIKYLQGLLAINDNEGENPDKDSKSGGKKS